MQYEFQDEETDATQEQIDELLRLGCEPSDLDELSSADAELLIDELRSKRIDAQRFEGIHG